MSAACEGPIGMQHFCRIIIRTHADISNCYTLLYIYVCAYLYLCMHVHIYVSYMHTSYTYSTLLT